jgi:hypothetical protein
MRDSPKGRALRAGIGYCDRVRDRRTGHALILAAVGGAVLAITVAPFARAADVGAAPEFAPRFTGGSVCPSPAETWAELVTLLPRERLASRLGPGTAADIAIFDAGSTYRVNAGGRAREYRDEARDCRHRARVTALFIALAIDPADLALAPAPRPATLAGVAGRAPPDETPPSFRLRFEAGAAGVVGTSPDERVAQGGITVRAAIGAGRFALSAGLAGLVPSDSDVGPVRVRLWRMPADVGARATFTFRALAPYVELGMSAALVSVRGVDDASRRTATAVELGARGTAGIRLRTRSRCSPFFALTLEVIPSPPAVFALPQGTVGRTPYVWIGANAGVSLGVHATSRR